MTSWETTLVDYSLPRGNRLAPRAGCIDVDDCERCKSRPAGDEGLCSECVDAVDERHTYDDGTRRIRLGGAMNVELPNEKPVDDDVGCSECGDVLDADGFCWTCAMEAEAERNERLRREEEQRG